MAQEPPPKNTEPTLSELGLDDAKPRQDPFGKALQSYEYSPDELPPTWVNRVSVEPSYALKSNSRVILFAIAVLAGTLFIALLPSYLSFIPSAGETTVNIAVELVEAKLVPFRNAANGKMAQEVSTTWKNNGSTPVRVVDGEITSINADGSIRDSFNYTLYAEFDNAPGIAPGATHTTPAGSGFILPGFQGFPGYSPASSVRVRVTKVSEFSGL